LDTETINQAISDAKLPKVPGKQLQKIISSLYELFTIGDCDLLEVNPLAIVKARRWWRRGKVLALDSKISLDTNASFRHEEFAKFESEIPIPETEKIAKAKGLNFIKLDGTVGIIGNGAGLVMSTLDLVETEGGRAANFLDIGGGAKAETVSAALEVLEDDKNVQCVLINIFGGITRCDLVAKGIVDATQGKSLPWKIIVRLDGTNSEEGRKILHDNQHENIIVANNMKEAAKEAVKEAVGV
jgi:succinyl-CoA synthetase beta subunit